MSDGTDRQGSAGTNKVQETLAAIDNILNCWTGCTSGSAVGAPQGLVRADAESRKDSGDQAQQNPGAPSGAPQQFADRRPQPARQTTQPTEVNFAAAPDPYET